MQTAIDRFKTPEGITDVCQGLGWWMDDPVFDKVNFNMPIDENLRTLTKTHWDKYLNKDYECPHIRQGLENELDHPNKDATNPKCTSGADPESVLWKGNRETGSFFLFQDQRHTSYDYGNLALTGAEVYHAKGTALTLDGVTKEFTTMNGNYNGKVQTLQPMMPLDPRSAPFTYDVIGVITSAVFSFQTFWVAVDRIWPSEWTVQALFTLGWNDRQFDENKIVGGYNDFGRRPTTIVKASGHEHDGEMIEEAIWQYLERSCEHYYENPKSKVKAAYTGKNKYDKDLGVQWEELDQDVRDWWRALGLGVQRESCFEADTRVTTENTCISLAPGCKRVNYHTVQRWHQNNNEDLAEERFNARDFTSIFFSYSCEQENDDGATLTLQSSLSPVKRMYWDAVDLADDGKIKEAATQLGYDQEEWDRHRADPTSAPPDNLVLEMENYLEGEAYWSSFFWTQIVCAMIMISVSLIEIRHIFLWYHLTRGPRSFWPIVLVKPKKPDHVQPGKWHKPPNCPNCCGPMIKSITNPKASLFWSCDCDRRKCSNWFHYSQRWQCSASTCRKNICFKCSPGPEPIHFKWVGFTTAFWVRFWSFFLSVLSYVVIPVLVIEVSLLLILESANSLDVIKDTLALLFLLEINNFLQIRSTPSAGKWKMSIKGSKLKEMSRHKNLFTLMMFASLSFVAWITTVAVHSGLSGRYHPSILFNPWRDRPQSEDWWPRSIFGLLIGLVFVVFGSSWVWLKKTEMLLNLGIWNGDTEYIAPEFSFRTTNQHTSDSGRPMFIWMHIVSYEDKDAKPADGSKWKDVGPTKPLSGAEIVNPDLGYELYKKALANKFLEFSTEDLKRLRVSSDVDSNSYIKVGLIRDYAIVEECAKYFKPAETKIRKYRFLFRKLGEFVYLFNSWYTRGFLVWLRNLFDPVDEMDEDHFIDDSEDEDDSEYRNEGTESETAGQNAVGRWTQQYSRNGQLVEVLVNQDDNRIMAQRRVGDPSTFIGHAGDTSGFQQWSVKDPVAPQFSTHPGFVHGFPPPVAQTGVLCFAGGVIGSRAPQPVANMMYTSPSAVPMASPPMMHTLPLQSMPTLPRGAV